MADEESKSPENDKQEKKPKTFTEETPVKTSHSLTLSKKTLRYTTTAGRMPLKNKEDEIEAQIYFTAYTLDGVKDVAERPLVFVFNGGPGSGSVWLHLGALGPKRVKMQDEGWMPAPPYKLVDNEYTWLDQADLVFIDPVGTGYSRARDLETSKKYWNLKGDIESVGEFIRLYLTRYERWSSPLFLAGESYGTTRAAGLSDHLVEKGIGLNGIILISTVMNFQTLSFDRGNDLPYAVFLPTYTATAWYHGKLPADLQAKSLAEVLAEVEDWTTNQYFGVLAKGNTISEKERQAVVKRLVRYTGLSARYIEQTNLRVEIFRFDKELLREENRTVGRLDSRFKGRDALAITETPEFDPSMVAIMPPYTSMMNDYARRQLRYETEVVYESLSYDVHQNWEYDQAQYPDTSEALRAALAKNPFMKVLVGMGYYDLATPHFAALYTLSHMDIDPELRDNIQTATYEAGHMYYLDVKSLAKFKDDVEGFFKTALG